MLAITSRLHNTKLTVARRHFRVPWLAGNSDVDDCGGTRACATNYSTASANAQQPAVPDPLKRNPETGAGWQVEAAMDPKEARPPPRWR
jgi:hypothetical protein